MAAIDDPAKGIVSASAGFEHNDVAIINNIVFTATDEGIYSNKAFHTHMDTPESALTSNDGMHATDIKASQIESGNFDGDADLNHGAQRARSDPDHPLFRRGSDQPAGADTNVHHRAGTGATELVIPGEIEESSAMRGTSGDECWSASARPERRRTVGDEGAQTWNGSLIFYDHTSL